MSRWLYVVIASVLGVTLTAAAFQVFGDPAFDEAAPVWEPGYTWTYGSTAHIDLVIHGEGKDRGNSDQETVQIDQILRMEVLNADASVGERPAYLVVFEETTTRILVDGATIYAQDEPMDAPGEVSEVVASTCTDTCVTFARVTKDDLTVHPEGEEPKVGARYSFPLTNGKEWTVAEASAAFNGDEREGRPIKAVAERLDRVDVAGIGTTDAIRVVTDFTSTDSDSPSKGLNMQIQMAVEGTEHYAGAAKAAVQWDQLVESRIKITMEDSGSSSHADIESHGTLIEHRLDPKPARTAEEYLNGETALPFAPADPWPFAIAATADSVDSAAATEVLFSVDESTSSLGDDAQIRWFYDHFGIDERTRTETAGDTFRLVADSPGLHRVSATVHDADGRLRAIASTHVEAYSTHTLRLDGPLGAAYVAEDDSSLALTVAPGARPAEIAVTPAVLARGQIVLTPEAGSPSTVESEGGDHSLDLPPGRYDLTWQDTARAGALELTIAIHYELAELTRDAAAETGGSPAPTLKAALDQWHQTGMSGHSVLPLLR